MTRYIFGICNVRQCIPKMIREFVNRNHSRKLKVIDIGAGYGDKTKFFIKHGFYVLAVEPHRKLIEVIKKEVREADIIRAVVEYLPIRSNTFDVVLFWNVVMFVSDLERTIKNILDISKEGANLFIAYYKLKNERKLANIVLNETQFIELCRKFGHIIKHGKRFRDIYHAHIKVAKYDKN